MTAVTWFDGSTNERHSALSIPHFTFRIPQFRILPTTYTDVHLPPAANARNAGVSLTGMNALPLL